MRGVWRLAVVLKVRRSNQLRFLAGAGGSIESVEGLLDLERFFRRDDWLFTVEHAAHEMMNAILGERDFVGMKGERFVAVEHVAVEPGGPEAHAGIGAEQVDAIFAGFVVLEA